MNKSTHKCPVVTIKMEPHPNKALLSNLLKNVKAIRLIGLFLNLLVVDIKDN